MRSKQPFYILAFGVVTSDVDFMLSFIFPHDIILNTEACIK